MGWVPLAEGESIEDRVDKLSDETLSQDLVHRRFRTLHGPVTFCGRVGFEHRLSDADLHWRRAERGKTLCPFCELTEEMLALG